MAADGSAVDEACCGACAHAVKVERAGGAPPSTGEHLRFALDAAGAPRGAELVMVVRDGPEQVRRIDRRELIIGRTPPADIVVDLGTLSRRQCSFRFTASGEVVITDLQSTCGTFVNGESVGYGGGRALREGDVVYVADLTMMVRRAERG